jgi:CRP/FNR family transcriptional regulator
MNQSSDDIAALLARSPLCHGMAPEAAAALAHHASQVELARGDALYGEGAPAESLFLVARGVVKLVHSLDSGRDVIVELVGRGEMLGEASLTDDATYDNSAVCVHPTEALAIHRRAAQAFVVSNPAAIRNVLGLLHQSLVRSHQRVEDLSVFRVRRRIARLLVRLAGWSGREEHGRTVVPVALSRQELAALVGTTIETTIRVMSDLRRDGLVEPARRGVVLNDLATLRLVAEQP